MTAFTPSRATLLALVLMALRPTTALPDEIGDGTFDIVVNPARIMTGTGSLADHALEVFGHPVNLGPEAITITGLATGVSKECFDAFCEATRYFSSCFFGHACTSDSDCAGACLLGTGTMCQCRIKSGTYETRAVGSSPDCVTCGPTCGGCGPSCQLCYNDSGQFSCPSGCINTNVSSAPRVSFLGSLTTLTGSLVSALPPRCVTGQTTGCLLYSTDGTADAALDSFTGTADYSGRFGINAAEWTNTHPGLNVDVPIMASFFNSGTAQQVTATVDVQFTQVASPGVTSVVGLSSASGPMPPNFTVEVAGVCSGHPAHTPCTQNQECPAGQHCDNSYAASFFDVSTTAPHQGDITVCISYPDMATPRNQCGDGIVDGTTLNEAGLHILHRDAATGTFVDVTSTRDPCANKICGVVRDLSPFALAVDTRIPGGGKPRTDCISEWDGNPLLSLNSSGLPGNTLTCHDGAPCDAGGAILDGECKFLIGICPNVGDTRLPGCLPGQIFEYTVLKPRTTDVGPSDPENLAAILGHLLDLDAGKAELFQDGRAAGVLYRGNGHFGSACAEVPIVVPLRNDKKGTKTLKLRVTTETGVEDTDTLKLVCEPS